MLRLGPSLVAPTVSIAGSLVTWWHVLIHEFKVLRGRPAGTKDGRCKPEFAETLTERAEKRAAVAYKSQIRAEVTEAMRREFQKTIIAEAESEAGKSARKIIKQKLRREIT